VNGRLSWPSATSSTAPAPTTARRASSRPTPPGWPAPAWLTTSYAGSPRSGWAPATSAWSPRRSARPCSHCQADSPAPPASGHCTCPPPGRGRTRSPWRWPGCAASTFRPDRHPAARQRSPTASAAARACPPHPGPATAAPRAAISAGSRVHRRARTPYTPPIPPSPPPSHGRNHRVGGSRLRVCFRALAGSCCSPYSADKQLPAPTTRHSSSACCPATPTSTSSPAAAYTSGGIKGAGLVHPRPDRCGGGRRPGWPAVHPGATASPGTPQS
jgi:hypothetical protein